MINPGNTKISQLGLDKTRMSDNMADRSVVNMGSVTDPKFSEMR